MTPDNLTILGGMSDLKKLQFIQWMMKSNATKTTSRTAVAVVTDGANVTQIHTPLAGRPGSRPDDFNNWIVSLAHGQSNGTFLFPALVFYIIEIYLSALFGFCQSAISHAGSDGVSQNIRMLYNGVTARYMQAISEYSTEAPLSGLTLDRVCYTLRDNLVRGVFNENMTILSVNSGVQARMHAFMVTATRAMNLRSLTNGIMPKGIIEMFQNVKLTSEDNERRASDAERQNQGLRREFEKIQAALGPRINEPRGAGFEQSARAAAHVVGTHGHAAEFVGVDQPVGMEAEIDPEE
jgi:hypothetical protein